MMFAQQIKLLKDTLKGNPPAVASVHHKALAKPALHLRIDSSKITVRHLSDKALARFSKSDDFDYKDQKTDTASLLERILSWLAHLFNSNPKQQQPTSPYITYILLAAVFGIIIFVLIKMARQNGINIIGNESQKIDMGAGLPEDIHQITFEEEIEKATAAGNYRLAVRLLYLRTLKQLNDDGLINWKLEKTNTAYYYELHNKPQQQLFSVITRQFEYVWYGNFTVDAASYQNISQLFANFKQQLP